MIKLRKPAPEKDGQPADRRAHRVEWHRLLLAALAAGGLGLLSWAVLSPATDAGSAADHALSPLVTSAALLPAVAWAVLALLMPVLVRGRSLGLDIAGACVWGVGILAAHDGLGRLLSHDPTPHGLWAGPILAVVAAVAATGAGLRGSRFGAAGLS